MLHHLSIPAREPRRVAEVLAELLDGVCLPFPPNPGSFITVARDGNGTAVEVYPADSVIMPNGLAGGEFVRTGHSVGYGAVHFALSVDSPLADIEAISQREGWECYVCSRGGDFDVVEVWIDNRFLVELLPPEFTARYLDFADQIARSDSPWTLMASHERPVPA